MNAPLVVTSRDRTFAHVADTLHHQVAYTLIDLLSFQRRLGRPFAFDEYAEQFLDENRPTLEDHVRRLTNAGYVAPVVD